MPPGSRLYHVPLAVLVMPVPPARRCRRRKAGGAAGRRNASCATPITASRRKASQDRANASQSGKYIRFFPASVDSADAARAATFVESSWNRER